MAPGTLTKTYRRTGREWTRPEVHGILGHATDMAKKHGTEFVIGEDDEGGITVCLEGSLPRDTWRICSTTASKPTHRQGAEWELETYSRCGLSYTDDRLQVDDAVSRILDHLAYGIVESGPLLDMTLGLEQMWAALESARRIQKRRGGRIICGIKRSRTNEYPEHVVAVSQMSKRPEFVEPLAAVISDDGVSMLNRPHGVARLKPDSRNGDPDKVWRGIRTRIANRIYYGGWGFSTRLYGVLEAGKVGIKILQDEITDRAIICRDRVHHRGNMIQIRVNEYGHLECTHWPDKDAAVDTSIDIDTKNLWDGDRISKDAVARSAQDAVRKFSKLQPFAPRPDKQGRFLGHPSFPGPEENYPSSSTSHSGGPATFPAVYLGF